MAKITPNSNTLLQKFFTGIVFVKQARKEREWNDSYQVNEKGIPDYRIAEDKFASGYLAGLKRQKRLNKYLHVVYDRQTG